ncbi:MAG: CPBP family intramembrane glutamic endopeptidase, partial [Amphiplicatus sp.]
GQTLIDTAAQLGVVLVLCFMLWAIFGRKAGSFARYVGLVAPTRRAMGWALALALVVGPLTVAYYYFSPLRDLASGPNTVAGEIRAMGFSLETVAVIAILGFVKTALAEEIFFRGLIAKRLINLAGFWPGNIMQATLFAAVHLLLFAVPGGPAFSWALAGPMLAILLVTSLVKVWLNERIGNGSIAPGWLIHGALNAVAYPVLAFA